jgi:hypothetical protein
MRKNEPVAAYRTTTLYIFEDDGVTPAPAGTVGFTVVVRKSGGTFAAAAGTFANVGGVDGEWEYVFTQGETNVDANQLIVKATKTGFNPASAIEQLDSPTLRNIYGLQRRNSLLDGGFGSPNVQYNGNGIMTFGRLRVFKSAADLAAAVAGHADNADNEVARYTFVGTDTGGGLLAQFTATEVLEL